MSILQELETTAVQYDEHVKRILCNRYVLAWILKCTTLEFSELSIKQIAEECISEDISISKVRVMPGRTNTDVERKGERILGANTRIRFREKERFIMIFAFPHMHRIMRK